MSNEERKLEAALAQVNKEFDGAFARRAALRDFQSKKTKELLARRKAGEQLDELELGFLFRMGVDK